MESGTMDLPAGALADDDPQFAGQFDDGPQDVHEGDGDGADGAAETSPEVEEPGPLFDVTAFEEVVGGKAPTTEKVRLYGGAVQIEPPVGGFKKGSRYVLRVEVLCFKDTFTDEIDDKTNQVVGCRDERGLKITGSSLVDE